MPYSTAQTVRTLAPSTVPMTPAQTAALARCQSLTPSPASTNPRFDRARFLRACGVETTS